MTNCSTFYIVNSINLCVSCHDMYVLSAPLAFTTGVQQNVWGNTQKKRRTQERTHCHMGLRGCPNRALEACPGREK